MKRSENALFSTPLRGIPFQVHFDARLRRTPRALFSTPLRGVFPAGNSILFNDKSAGLPICTTKSHPEGVRYTTTWMEDDSKDGGGRECQEHILEVESHREQRPRDVPHVIAHLNGTNKGHPSRGY